MKHLTRTEEQIMQVIWDLENCFVKEVIEKLPKPKPPYNTISSVVRILEKKGFLAYNAYGRTHQYYPIITKEEYSRFAAQSLLENYFSGSIGNLVSTFTKSEKLSKEEINELINRLKNHNNKS